jgi:hypothetical protein
MARVFTLVALHTILLASQLPAALAADRVRVDFYAEGEGDAARSAAHPV